MTTAQSEAAQSPAVTPQITADLPRPGTQDPMRHHLHYKEGDSSFMERLAAKVASGMGTVKFLVISAIFICAWVAGNVIFTVLRFDPYPFILLNLLFSAVAFFTGSLVIIAQKAQIRTAQANEEAAAKHREELAQYNTHLLEEIDKLLEQINTLLKENTDLTEEVHKLVAGQAQLIGQVRGLLENQARSEESRATVITQLAELTQEVHTATCGGAPSPTPAPVPA